MSHGLPCKKHLIAKTINRPHCEKLCQVCNQFEIAERQIDDIERARNVDLATTYLDEGFNFNNESFFGKSPFQEYELFFGEASN